MVEKNAERSHPLEPAGWRPTGSRRRRPAAFVRRLGAPDPSEAEGGNETDGWVAEEGVGVLMLIVLCVFFCWGGSIGSYTCVSHWPPVDLRGGFVLRISIVYDFTENHYWVWRFR